MTGDKILTDSELRALPDLLLSHIRGILGDKLVGFYVVGSLVTGDFDSRSSDIDLIATTSTDLDEAEVQRLDAMHAALIYEEPKRDNRIEILYIPVDRLKADQAYYNIAIISPGEPFHVKEIRHDDWTLNWYVLREKGIALFGSNPRTLVDPISQETLVRVVQALSRATPEWIDPGASLGGQGYVILTLCRALRLVRTGDFVSKKQAALWAVAVIPEWASLIRNALIWRVVGRANAEDREAVFPETRRFVHFIIDRIVGDANTT